MYTSSLGLEAKDGREEESLVGWTEVSPHGLDIAVCEAL
jgi:hypothetical protein